MMDWDGLGWYAGVSLGHLAPTYSRPCQWKLKHENDQCYRQTRRERLIKFRNPVQI